MRQQGNAFGSQLYSISSGANKPMMHHFSSSSSIWYKRSPFGGTLR
ncbi:hypothetical protein SNOG_02852 [Parastagonospora nodorum SN15]|uniref:Uncharacterized protein n=1 Tax=Phaeosphaeria nodorum (strain SN15 / ATCC MYA-4574 / FGSC 10173) TaxID=321614 RepID=Q0UZG2_PHANO|nr:hypothetical protein SNOG_02852 [Parastagonospora nodorum SN15]EAT89583.1 hypothetical protein SNOG_02852 [Parastagonospora nodorum SN15]